MLSAAGRLRSVASVSVETDRHAEFTGNAFQFLLDQPSVVLERLLVGRLEAQHQDGLGVRSACICLLLLLTVLDLRIYFYASSLETHNNGSTR